MPPDAQRHLIDMRDAASAALGYVAGRTAADYRRERLLRSGVERELLTVGEAAVRLRRDDLDTAKRITDIGDIIALRNPVIHVYDAVDPDKVWENLQRDLPVLIAELDSLIAGFEGRQDP